MKILKLTFIIIFIANLSFSQYDPAAKEVLDKVAETAKSYETIKADFKFVMENVKEDIHESFKGNLKLKDEKYILELMGAETYFDGVTIWTYLKESNEVNISDYDNNGESILGSPSKLFDSYTEGFKYKLVDEKYNEGKVLYIIDLFPEKLDLNLFPGQDDEGEAFTKIQLQIEQQNFHISKIIYHGRDGNIYIIEIEKIIPNKKMDDKSFVFDAKKHPDVEVIDLRD